MRIGILGSGYVGKALAKGFAGEGYAVTMATRTPDSPVARELAKSLVVQVDTYGKTAAASDLVVLCAPWHALENVLMLAGTKHLEHKVVIDTTNPFTVRKDVPLRMEVGTGTSAGEIVQHLLPHAHVVKAFNTTISNLMYRPDFGGAVPTMPICGRDKLAKDMVTDILHRFGWNSVDAGDISSARQLEELALLLIKIGRQNGNFYQAMQLLTATQPVPHPVAELKPASTTLLQ